MVDKNLLKKNIFEFSIEFIEKHSLNEIEIKISETNDFYEPSIFYEILFDIGLYYSKKKINEKKHINEVKISLIEKGFDSDITERIIVQTIEYNQTRNKEIETIDIKIGFIISVISGIFMYLFYNKNEILFFIFCCALWFGIGKFIYSSYEAITEYSDRNVSVD